MRGIMVGIYTNLDVLLKKTKAADEYFLSKLENVLGKSNSNYDREVVIVNEYFVLNNVIDQKEEFEIDGGGGGGHINPPVSETAMVNETRYGLH